MALRNITLRGGTGDSDIRIASSVVDSFRQTKAGLAPKFFAEAKSTKRKIVRGKQGAKIRGICQNYRVTEDGLFPISTRLVKE